MIKFTVTQQIYNKSSNRVLLTNKRKTAVMYSSLVTEGKTTDGSLVQKPIQDAVRYKVIKNLRAVALIESHIATDKLSPFNKASGRCAIGFKVPHLVKPESIFVNTAVKKISSSVRINIARENTIPSVTKEIESSILSTPGGGGTGALSLDFGIEVHRFETRRFKFPRGYLTGLQANGIAKAVGDYLQINADRLGNYTLTVDKGNIFVNVIPGFNVSDTYQVKTAL